MEVNLIGNTPRINEQIRARKVRLIDPDGRQVGIVSLEEALDRSIRMDLDLVEVSPHSDPPVCRIMDYGKYKYEQEQREKEARKKQSQIVIKEIKIRPKIDTHDLEFKKRHMERFLKDGARVKVTVMFRGRELAHPDLGKRLLDRIAEDLEGLAEPESEPKLDGRNMVMVLIPGSKR